MVSTVLTRASLVKHLAAMQEHRSGSDPWVSKIPWRRAWQPSAVLLPGDSRGPRSLAAAGREAAMLLQPEQLNAPK